MPRVGRPTYDEINLDALEHNFAQVKNSFAPDKSILAVVKANAYGHGAVTIAKALEGRGVDFLGVATCEEAIELRRASISRPIIVLGGCFEGQASCVQEHDLIPVVYNTQQPVKLLISTHALDYTTIMQIDYTDLIIQRSIDHWTC